MNNSTVSRAQGFGQSLWFDCIDRSMLQHGQLAALIRDDHVSGFISNPLVLKEALRRHSYHLLQILGHARRGLGPREIYETMTIEDVRCTADLLGSIFEHSNGRDGWVSMEIAPDRAATAYDVVAEATRLWTLIGKTNVMIQIPGTAQCLPAIRQLIAAGISVNVAPLYCARRWQEVAVAHQQGLEERLAAGLGIDRIGAVSGFAVNRIDQHIDERLESLGKVHLLELRGKTAVAAGKIAYDNYRRYGLSSSWRSLAAQNAHPLRLMWLGLDPEGPVTGSLKYVDALISEGTVAVLSPHLLGVCRDRGRSEIRVDQDLRPACEHMDALSALGIDYERATQRLENDEIHRFAAAFTELLTAIGEISQQCLHRDTPRRMGGIGTDTLGRKA